MREENRIQQKGLFHSNQYDVILADPPWPYNSRCHHSKTRFGGGVSNQYPTMNIEQICALPVWSIAAPDSILFIWTTGPHLENVFAVIGAWGFRYKTIGFTWVKMNKKKDTPFFGTGFYSKHNAELCLLATRGDSIKPAVNDVSSLVKTPIGKHSEKPKEIHRRIERMYPTQSKLELFARDKLIGWSSWGNEIESDLELEITG